MPYEFVLTETRGAIGIVKINRPQVRNALNDKTIAELVDALEGFDREAAIRCMILTGDDRAFAAGADIAQMADAAALRVPGHDPLAACARLCGGTKPAVRAGPPPTAARRRRAP